MNWVRAFGVCARVGVCAALLLAVAPDTAVAETDQSGQRAPAASRETRDGDQAPDAADGARRVAGSLIQFRPPARGAPTRRVGASTRSGTAVAQLNAIAPRTAAYTADPAPTLYWDVGPSGLPAVVTVIAFDRIDPVIEIPVGVPSAGLQATALSAHGVRLRAGVEHEWSVALVADPQARSRDIVASARFFYMPGGPAIPAEADRTTRLQALAAGGYWYDLMHAILGPDAKPDEPELFQALLRDVGLTAVRP